MNSTSVKVFSWSQLTVGIAALLFVAWLAISTHGFNAEYDLHGFAAFGAIVIGLFGIAFIVSAMLTIKFRFGPIIGGLVSLSAIVLLLKAFFL